MAVMVTLVTVSCHLNATCIDTAIQSLMEGHDLNLLSLVGIGLFCELEHSLSHAIVIVILLELNAIVTAPWMDVIGIIIAPNTLWSVSRFVFLER